MAEPKTIEARFPLSGVVRRPSAWADVAMSEKPYTPWCVNMRPEDLFERRLRGGSRPGLVPYLYNAEPEWPDGALYTEGDDMLLDAYGDPILDQDGNPTYSAAAEAITDEDGVAITVPITGSSALGPAIIAAMEAYGYGELTEVLAGREGAAAPIGCTIGCRYRDRLVVAGADNIIYMSKQGDYAGWSYGEDVEDVGRAVFFQLSEAGEVGKTVTALVPHKDMSLLASTEYGLWLLKEDPAHEGAMTNLSRDVGIISATAWTKVGDSVFFLSRDGLWVVNLDGSGLKNVSGDRLPEELEDIDLTTTTVMMGYRHEDQGVYIFLQGDEHHYFFDLAGGGFWPFTLSTPLEAVFIVEGTMLVKDTSNNLWTFDGEDDNGTDIQSHVLLGPFRAQSDSFFGLLTTISAGIEVEPLDSGAVAWRIVTGDTAMEACIRAKDAVENYLDGNTTTALEVVRTSGSWSDGRSKIAHPRVRAPWIVVWLSSNDVWAFESMFLEMVPAGGWR